MKRLKEFFRKVKRIVVKWSDEFEKKGREKMLKEELKKFIDSL